MMAMIGKNSRYMRKAINYLNDDWKTKALSDEREVPYKGILVIMLLGSQFLTSLLGLKKTQEGGV